MNKEILSVPELTRLALINMINSLNKINEVTNETYSDSYKEEMSDYLINVSPAYTYELNVEELKEYNNQFDISKDKQITTLKSQLKHCKNYLERQNIERRLNKLYKERR